jgi:hypothetical protein
LDDVGVGWIELGMVLALTCRDRQPIAICRWPEASFHARKHRLWKPGREATEKRSIGFHRSEAGWPVGDIVCDFKLSFAGYATRAADQPIHFRVDCCATELCILRHIQLERKKHLVLVSEIHEGAKGQPLRRRELQLTCSDAVGECPLHMRRFACVAGVFPVDMPARFQLEIETRVSCCPASHALSGHHESHVHVGRIGRIRDGKRRHNRRKRQETGENQTEDAHE